MEIVDLKELALKKVKINGKVIGKFGTFEIEQIFKNNTKNVLEVGYTFPIVETATVIGFEINVGNKILKGKCKEKGEAKKEYQRNIVQGNSAYMMEQASDNIFKISIGKIGKGEEVKLKIYYIDKFEITDNTIKILIPTLVTPRYKSNITNKLIFGKVDYTVDFNINVSKALNRKSINCVSHKINLIDEEKTERVEVLNYDLSSDFKLYIELKNELSSNAIISKTRDDKEMIYLSFMPEILDTYEDSEKEYMFIFDISGSMSGNKLEETKKAVIECLKQLDIGDKFNIIPFESRFSAMNINSIEYNEENLQKAIEYVNNLQTMGGTEILNPIKFALYQKETDKIILLFTDGQVGNEQEIIQYVDENIKTSRIFPFGIDTNVNSSFIKQLAKVGNGKAELIQPNEKIDDKIIRTFARIQTPLLENLEIDYGKNKVIDEIKEERCLFNYEFFNVFTKLENLEDDIILKGKIQNKEYSWKISKESIQHTDVDLEVLFAKQQMDRLEEYIRNTYESDKIENYKNMIIELAEKYNINSKYTSFITVYERENKLLEIPQYQETILSNKFMETDKCYLGAPTFLRKASCDSLDIPSFERENKTIKKTTEEILEKKVNEYYKEFIKQEAKPILTYILYAICCKNDIQFNHAEFLNFLNDNKDAILANNTYMQLVYKYYEVTRNSQILEFLDDDYKKAAYTNMKIDVNFKLITIDEAVSILNENSLKENIDEILWYLSNRKYSWR